MIKKVLLFLIFLSFSLGQLGRISFLDQQINFYFYELFLAVFCFFKLLNLNKKKIINKLINLKIIFIFLGYLLFSFFLNINQFTGIENLISFLYWLRLSFYFLVLITLDEEDLKFGIRIFFYLTVISSLIQYFLYPNLRNLIYLGWDPHQFRLFGLFFDTYLAGAIYGLGFFYFLYSPKKTFLDYMMLFFYFIFIFMTFSRITYISLFFTLFIYYFFYQKRKRFFIFLFSAALVIIILLPKPSGAGVDLGRFFSIKSRMVDYQLGLNWWQKKPIFGWGYNRIRYLKKDLFSHSGASFHSSFLIILVTAGLIGLILFILTLAKIVKGNQQAIFYLLFLIICSLTDNVLLHPFILFLFFSMIKKQDF